MIMDRSNAPAQTQPMISISIVSHGQGDLVGEALADLAQFRDVARFEVILTKNLPELLPFSIEGFPYPLRVIENAVPKGFGANHNAAFLLANGLWFCVMNPDIRLPTNPFPALLEDIESQDAALIAPAVVGHTGRIEDSIRRFPTPLSLLAKLLGRHDGRYSYCIGEDAFTADWVAGMFMMFRAGDFRHLSGFDERFHLYYEDVDICARMWESGRKVLACPKACVTHHARRASRSNLRYMRWHASSMARYLGKHWLRLPKSGRS